MKIQNLSLTLHNGRRLVTDCSFSLNPGDKLAIIGEEGNGKSSLLWAIFQPELLSHVKVCGQVLTSGEKLGLLSQQLDTNWLSQTVSEYLLKEFPERDISPERYNDLFRYTSIFSKLSLSPALIEETRSISSLSGGEKVKLRLAKLLFEEPDILLLDEPTNDLDLETIEWLERFVGSWPGGVLFISHDIVFLEQTANVILHLENIQGKVQDRYTLFHGSYQDYVATRQRSLEKQQQLHDTQERKLRQQLIELNDQKNAVRSAQIKNKDSSARRILNKKMANILALKDRLDRQERTDVPQVEEAIRFVLPEVIIPPGQRVIELKLDQLKVEDVVLTGPVELSLYGGEKIAIIGKNGVGKTTLLRQLGPILSQDERFEVGFFPQDYREEFLDNDTPLNYLARYVKDMTVAQVQLGSVRFTREEMERPVTTLSQGQQAKLILVKLVLNGSNVILADEPTRNVSPLSAPVIHELFHQFGGSVLFVSHDRRFIERVADRVLELTEDGLREI